MTLHPVRNLALVVALTSAAGSAVAGTYTVTNTEDSGPGSLRQAILDAQADPLSTIVFAIGAGHQRIRPLSPLPPLQATLLDGRTQPGYAGAPIIEVDGSLMAGGNSCFSNVQWLWIDSLVINSCPYAGVRMGIGGGIRRSYVGTDVTGSSARPNAYGLYLSSYPSTGYVAIGGYRPGEGNVISGNGTGVRIESISGPTFVRAIGSAPTRPGWPP